MGVLDEKSSGEGFGGGGGGGVVGTSPFVVSAIAVSVEDCSPVVEVPSASSSSLISEVARLDKVEKGNEHLPSAYTSGCSLKQSCIALNFSMHSIPLGSASENTKHENASRN